MNGTIKDTIKNMNGTIAKAADALKGLIKKQMSMGGVKFTEAQQTQINTLADNLKKLNGEYAAVGNQISRFLNETQLKSRCNMAGAVRGYLAQRNNQLEKIISTELKNFGTSAACNGNSLVYINKRAGGSSGDVKCFNAANCQNISFNFKSNFDNLSLAMASGCVNNQRFVYAYSVDARTGHNLDFNLGPGQIQTCVKGQANKCAKEFAKMKKGKSMRLLQEGSQCVPKMKADCESVISENCEASKLFENLEQNIPSSSDNPLPQQCTGIDATNPNYDNCFKWINANLISYTLFPNMENIDNLQDLINKSQGTTLRYLQNSAEIKIVQSDASSTDTVAAMPADSTNVPSSDVAIDGATPDSVQTSADYTAEIESSSTSASFSKFGFALFALFAFLF